jgi:hypothetical protein
MRTFGTLVLSLAGLALLAGPAAAQRGGRGGRGPGGPGGGPYGILFLLQNKDIQKELDLSEEDAAKIPDAVMEALAKSLKPEQLKRLKQINLQVRGNAAFGDAKIQKQLSFTDEQKEKVTEILKEADAARRELFQSLRQGGDFQEMRKKMTEMNEEVTKKIQDVLTDDQKDKWKDMVGKPFKFEFGGRGRGPRPDR